MRKIITISSILIIVGSIVYLVIYTLQPNQDNPKTPLSISKDKPLTLPVQCYERKVVASPKEPFSSEEYIKLNFSSNSVEGTKFGFQKGPGYSNGFTGTLIGTRNDAEMILNYSYTVEGSKNTEQEIYTLTDNSLQRLFYPLIEKNKILTPDRTKQIRQLQYTPLDCSTFGQKEPR